MIHNSIILIAVSTLFISVLSCMLEDRSTSMPSMGGQCNYKKYSGKAEIISITHKSGFYEKYEIKFSFHAEEEIKEDFASTEHKKYLLLMNDSSNPGSDFVNRYEIMEGKQFDCYMKVITTGTCTPVLFEFPNFDLTCTDKDK